jgi:hypothetical protein
MEYIRCDLGPKVWKNLKYYKKRLRKAGQSRFRHYQGLEAKKYWPLFLAIENSGWKGRQGTSIQKASTKIRRYYEGLIEILAEENCLHIYFLELDGEAITGALGYFDQSTFGWLKTGYDERFSDLWPSNQLLLRVVEHLINDYPAIQRLHMFPWDHGYKHRFANTMETCIETVLFRETLRGRAYQLYSSTKIAIHRSARGPRHTESVLSR